MNTLIRFEDDYGCAALFNEITQEFKKNYKYTIKSGLCDSGVFNITRNEINSFDYAIIVFDLDEQNHLSLTGDVLIKRLNKFILKNGQIKEEYKDKIILIPVFLCYETLYLFSQHVQNTIKGIDTYVNNQPAKLIKMFKKYYDYSNVPPEYTDGLKHKLNSLKKEISAITNQAQKQGLFLPQHFHKAYSKQVLKILFKDIVSSHPKGDKLLDKNEETFFDQLRIYHKADFLYSIIDGLESSAESNRSFYKFLTASNISDIQNFVLTEARLNTLCGELDTYNKKMRQKTPQGTLCQH